MELYSEKVASIGIVLLVLQLSACGGGSQPIVSYSIGGQVSGLTGDGLMIRNMGGDNLTITANGTFTFDTRQGAGTTYDVTISTQPTGQTCTLVNGTGTVADTDVIDVMIGCPFVVVTPTVSAVGPKLLRISWNDVGADYYRLLKNPDGNSGYTPLGETVAGTHVDEAIPVHLTDWVSASYIVQACTESGECVDSQPLTITSVMIETIGYLKSDDIAPSNSPSEGRDRFGERVVLSGDGRVLAIGASGEAPLVSGTDPTERDYGAVYLFVREGEIWRQLVTIKASNPDMDDRFGAALSLSDDGNRLAVGAPGESSAATGIDGDQSGNSAPSAGAVYLFSRSGESWGQDAYIKASDTTSGDQFGNKVSLSSDGETLAISGRDSVYLFTQTDANWSQQIILRATLEENRDSFGEALQLSGDGNTLAVGAPFESASDNNSENSGAVYLFVHDGSRWSEQANIKASNADYFDHFGHDLALSETGDILAVGAKYESSTATGINGDLSDNTSESSGAVYLFERSGSAWNQITYLKASNADPYDFFGHQLALSGDGNTLAVSAAGEDSVSRGINGDMTDNSSQSPPGAVYLFRRSDDSWFQQAYVKASNTNEGYIDELDYMSCRPDPCWENDHFGDSLAISNDGTTLVVGAPGEDSGDPVEQEDSSAQASGAVYLY